MRQLYRSSTEAVVIVISAYAAAMAGLMLAMPFVATLHPAVQVAFSVLLLIAGGAGFYLFTDALQRVFVAVGDGFDRVMNKSIERTWPTRTPEHEGTTE